MVVFIFLIGFFCLIPQNLYATEPSLVKDINSGSNNAEPNYAITYNSELYFVANDGTNGRKIWRSDGTEGGTEMVALASSYDNPKNLTLFGGDIYFQACAAGEMVGSTCKIWKTDGTTEGTVVVGAEADYYGPDYKMAVFNNELYFNGYTDNEGLEPWKTDGTDAGTVMLKDIQASWRDSDPSGFTVFDGAIYFSAQSESDVELWKSDGSAGGTVMVRDVQDGTITYPYNMVVFNNELYFGAFTGEGNETELYKTDGTSGGTIKALDNVSALNPHYMTVFKDELYFASNNEFWKTDGTDLTQVKNIKIGLGSDESIPNYYMPYLIDGGSFLYFPADDGVNGVELWQSDGTDTGTTQVADLNPGTSSSYPNSFVILGNSLYFQANDGSHGSELWSLPLPSSEVPMTEDPPAFLRSLTHSFNNPIDVATDSEGSVFMADYYGGRIDVFDKHGTFVRQWNTPGWSPMAVAVGPSGSIYVAEGNEVLRYDREGNLQNKWGGSGTDQAGLFRPYELAVDKNGVVYVADIDGDRIQKYSAVGEYLATYSDDHIGQYADVAVDSDGIIYVLDAQANEVIALEANGTFTNSWGVEGNLNGQFTNPYHMALDNNHHLYIVDNGNQRVEKFATDGTFITKWGSQGQENNQFNYPSGITVDLWGRIYIVDGGNNRLQVFGAMETSDLSPTPTPTRSAYHSGDILINKISPLGSDEWLELFNTTDHKISLAGWEIGFNDEQNIPFAISSYDAIPKHGLLTINFGKNDHRLDDNSETVSLISPDSTVIDSITYGNEEIPKAEAANQIIHRQKEGEENWQADENYNKGWFNSTDSGPALATLTSELLAVGVTSNIASLEDHSRAQGLYFEKSEKGKIEFASTLNLTDPDVVSWLQNLDTKLDLNSTGKVGLDTAWVKDLIDTQATLTMYGVNLNNPKILVDGREDDSGVVSNLIYDKSAHTLTFRAAHFTTFTAVETATSGSGSQSSPASGSAPRCGDAQPATTPDLFQINVTDKSAKLLFTPISNTQEFYISFSTKPIAEEHGAEVFLTREGIQNYTVNLLKPKTTYYFKVRGQLGCMAGEWSNVMKVTTQAKGVDKAVAFYKNASTKKTVKAISSNKITPKKETAVVAVESPTLQPRSTPLPLPSKIVTEPRKKCFWWWCF